VTRAPSITGGAAKNQFLMSHGPILNPRTVSLPADKASTVTSQSLSPQARGTRRAIKSVGHPMAPLCIGGASDISPAFQRRVDARGGTSPEGTAEGALRLGRPFGTRSLRARIPALKRRAILKIPLRDKNPGTQCPTLLIAPGDQSELDRTEAKVLNAAARQWPSIQDALVRDRHGTGSTMPSL
jgi:hypothetical protein